MPVLKAIREKCLDCSGGSRAEVKDCLVTIVPIVSVPHGQESVAAGGIGSHPGGPPPKHRQGQAARKNCEVALSGPGDRVVRSLVRRSLRNAQYLRVSGVAAHAKRSRSAVLGAQAGRFAIRSKALRTTARPGCVHVQVEGTQRGRATWRSGSVPSRSRRSIGSPAWPRSPRPSRSSRRGPGRWPIRACGSRPGLLGKSMGTWVDESVTSA